MFIVKKNARHSAVHMYLEHYSKLELETAHQKNCCVLVNCGGQKEKKTVTISRNVMHNCPHS